MTFAELVRDRFAPGWYLPDDGSVILDRDVNEPIEPVRYDGDRAVYAPLRQRLIDVGIPTIMCPRCMQPSWSITRHAAEVHGDSDVEVLPILPNKTRPDWMQPDWV